VLKELFDVQEAVEEAVMSLEVRELASLIFYQHESLDDDQMKQALFAYAGRVASVTAFQLFRRLLTEEQLLEALDTIDELMEMSMTTEEDE